MVVRTLQGNALAHKLWLMSKAQDLSLIDSKHKRIVEKANDQEFTKFARDYRNWDCQSDCGIPFQVNIASMKSYGPINYAVFLVKCLIDIARGRGSEYSYFFDDLSLIMKLGYDDILMRCPVHKTPGNNLSFFITSQTSANIRWLRYIYFAGVIRDILGELSEQPTFLDIGSYYGGLQYVLKHLYPDSRMILVDFPHQLARSVLFLANAFPKAVFREVVDEKTAVKCVGDLESGTRIDFILVSCDFYSAFSDMYAKTMGRITLASNFYSLGEMNRESFDGYMGSRLIKESMLTYFCNRYDSSPFYERTYDVSYSLLDYQLNSHQVVWTRSSGIHAYMMPWRRLNGRMRARPISSGYFELLQLSK